MQDNSGRGNFYGMCWPGKSVWIDFFSTEAKNFWTKTIEE